MTAVDEARALIGELLPLAETLPIEDRRYLRTWQCALERGREINEAQLVWLRKLREQAEDSEVKIKKVA